MSISGISGYGQTSQVYGIEELEQYWEERRQSNQSTVSQYSSDQASFSQTGLLMSQLLQLSQTDQSQFKEVAQQISDDLATQAQSASTIQNEQALTDLSAKFAAAAQSGSMDSLRPEGPPPGGGSQGGGGGGVLGEISSTIANDLSGLSNASTTSSSTASLSGQEDPFGQLMQQLAALQTSDPEKFKQVTQQISSDLAEQAESSSDGFESQMLADMSSKFAEAAESGSMDSLQPQGPPPPPPPPQSSGQDDGSDSTSTAETGQSSKDLFSLLSSILAKDLAGVSNAGGAGNLFSLLSGQSTSGSSV